MKKVSIILPTYNGERFIKDSVNSILQQSYNNWELIIVNDCSTDNTSHIVNNLAKADSRIKIINNAENKKLPESLNIGFENATGDYYTWTSDDNMYKTNAIEVMVNYLNVNTEIDFVSFGLDYINEKGEYIGHLTDDLPTRDTLQLVKRCNVGACFMYRRQIAQKVGNYDKNMFCAEDYDYWCRVAIKGNISYQNENLYMYRINTQSLTATKSDIVQEKTKKIRHKYALPIMKKLKLTKKEQIEKLSELYKVEQDQYWLELINKFNKKKILLKNIFSIKNEYSDSFKKKIIRILGIKITIKRKN